MPYKVILADDHDILRAGLQSLIEKDKIFKIVAQASDGEELLLKLKTNKCDLVIIDLSMPNLSGVAAIQHIKKQFPKVKCLVLTMQKDHEHFKEAMQRGASGYILKEDAFEQLTLAMKVVLRGQQFISPSVSKLVTERYIRSLDEVETPLLEILTKREKEILRLVAEGFANKNIAAKLKISIRTVETHRFHLMEKLGIKKTAGLVRFAASKGLI